MDTIDDAGTVFTAEQKLEAVERELALRRRVYPTRVANGRMTEKLARFQIAIMAQIAEDYRRLAEQDRLL